MKDQELNCEIPFPQEAELEEDRRCNRSIYHADNTYFLRSLFPHKLLPKFNVNSQYNIKEFAELKEFPSCSFSVPHPIYVEPKHCSNVDLCHRRTLYRWFYKRRLYGAQKGYKLRMRGITANLLF